MNSTPPSAPLDITAQLKAWELQELEGGFVDVDLNESTTTVAKKALSHEPTASRSCITFLPAGLQTIINLCLSLFRSLFPSNKETSAEHGTQEEQQPLLPPIVGDHVLDEVVLNLQSLIAPENGSPLPSTSTTPSSSTDTSPASSPEASRYVSPQGSPKFGGFGDMLDADEADLVNNDQVVIYEKSLTELSQEVKTQRNDAYKVLTRKFTREKFDCKTSLDFVASMDWRGKALENLYKKLMNATPRDALRLTNQIYDVISNPSSDRRHFTDEAINKLLK